MNTIEEKCQQKGVRLTDQRKTIAKILSESKEVYGSKDHQMLMSFIRSQCNRNKLASLQFTEQLNFLRKQGY